MSATGAIARVLILPAAGDTGPLDYAVEPEMAPPAVGMRVLVPLGARTAVGIVTEYIDSSPHARLRKILAVLDARPIVDRSLLDLCRWLADYYLCSFAEAVTAALPGSVRIKTERVARLAADGDERVSDPRTRLDATQLRIVDELRAKGELTLSTLERAGGSPVRTALASLRRRGIIVVEHRVRPASGRTRQFRFYKKGRTLEPTEAEEWMKRRGASYQIYAYLAEHPIGRATLSELESSFGSAHDKLKRLQAAGLVLVEHEEVLRQVLPEAPGPDRPVELSVHQRQAVESIGAAIGTGFAPFLLFGVTGSGKTEVYLRSIATCLAAGRSALVLVPEISLTHQIIDRLRARFGESIAVLHSGLNDGERWDEWRRIAAGDVRIAVGARSAVFAPLPELGLLIVDEEHDAAYKQEDGVRYNGRDLAVMRGKISGFPVVLGSATPALESYVNARSERYRLLELPERVAARPLPSIDLVDLRRSNAVTKSALVSPVLRAALTANLAGKSQSLVFLNRRGFANFLQCHQCGTTLECPNCAVSLTFHQRWNALRCHHCDHTIPVPTSCPSCGGMALATWGAGTEQVEAALKTLVPGARVARLDRDTTARKGSQEKILSAWQRGERDILVGTQMVAKGHDVHNVTLVGVLLADGALSFPDFRAAERTFQTIAQVAGRAGRGTQPGRVIVQTFQPNHPSLKFAAHHDFKGFAEQELVSRREHSFPPYSRMIQLRCEGESPEATRQLAEQLRAALAGAREVKIMGPSPAPLERLRRRYRWQILLQGKDSAKLRTVARAGRDAVRAAALKNDVRVIVDVDPYSTL